jgi:hypothetical protein
MPKCLQCGNWESVTVSHCSRCGSLMPPPDEAARAAHRERRRKVHEEQLRPPTPQEARERDRRAALDVIGCLMPIPAVAVAAGVAVVVAGEALLVALVAAVAGTITGWLIALVIWYRAQKEFRGPWERRSLVYEWVAAYLPYAAAVGVTLLVSRIL